METKQNPCPLANADRRLTDALNLWIETKTHYCEPDQFRLSLNNLIQALRNITFVLQKQKNRLSRFEKWYGLWQDKMRSDPLMRWLVSSRNLVVKQGDLDTRSIARIGVVETWFDPPVFEVEIPPFSKASNFARIMRERHPKSSESGVSLLRIERRWVDARLPDQELLEALAHVFNVLSELLFDAHDNLLDKTRSSSCTCLSGMAGPKGQIPPCMLAQEWDRIIWMNMETGAFCRPEQEVIKCEENDVPKMLRRYPHLPSTVKKLKATHTLDEKASVYFEHAKTLLVKDGSHVSVALLGYPGKPILPMSLVMEDRAQKHLVFRSLAATIKKTGATSLFLIGEMWVSTLDRSNPVQHASDDPKKKEALELIAADNTGRVISRGVMFSRDEAGKVVLGETWISNQSSANLLAPIRKAWGIGKRGDVSPAPQGPGAGTPTPGPSSPEAP